MLQQVGLHRSCSPTLAVQLNVYAEGDFFKAHIDTPHGTDMLGSLVVCLPCAHTGGALLVKHLGQEVRWCLLLLSSAWCSARLGSKLARIVAKLCLLHLAHLATLSR